MFPCQDTPSVKFTYTAQISVLRKFTVLMSARLSKCNKNWEEAVYKFNQRKPVPSYAVIIAVGVFQKKVLNNRIHVFAENKFIDESFNTFYLGAIESMLKIAESLCGPYVWGRYDVCVLPPSIAHFKIECPCVAFISPALLRGDRSSISYSLTRNISQSWAGNLVTCAHYNDLWLNKSFSIFISRKIICKMSIHEEMMPFLRREEIINVYYMIEKCWQSGNADLLKCLVPDLLQKDLLSHKTIDFVPYEMGCTLLDCLEDMLGPSLFESFLLSYFNEFAYKSISTDDWKKYLYRYFSDKKKMLDSLRWYAWFRVIPLLPIVPRMTALHIECRKLAKEWVQWNETSSIPSIILERRSLCDVQRELLLQYLYSFHTGLTKRKLKLILDIYIFDNDNGQIRFNWLLLCIKARWFEKVTTALDFATEFCSPMIACPIFEHLYEWIEMRSRAIKTYNRHKGKMLTETREMLDKILHIN
ncbi:leukotriene A-4 hydrolase-like [Temnothorax nylanderi]|uniref:leukotriene A-4 hydrolase-like n=1 Tax=Temnothorax nylanderi TaxID=102681 RepID=UPI003A868D8D